MKYSDYEEYQQRDLDWLISHDLIYLENDDVVVLHIRENPFDQPIVDGSLDINVYNLIKNTFNIELPIAGEKYQFSDYTETYGFDCYLIF